MAANGYSQEDLEEEVLMMMEGGYWVDFDDGRTRLGALEAAGHGHPLLSQ